MDKITISVLDLFKIFPDEAAARRYLESRRWPDGVRCPVCTHGERIATRPGGYYRCHACAEDFTVRTGTLFERSHVVLHHWMVALFLCAAEPDITIAQLSHSIKVTMKTAWLMRRRIREALTA